MKIHQSLYFKNLFTIWYFLYLTWVKEDITFFYTSSSFMANCVHNSNKKKKKKKKNLFSILIKLKYLNHKKIKTLINYILLYKTKNYFIMFQQPLNERTTNVNKITGKQLKYRVLIEIMKIAYCSFDSIKHTVRSTKGNEEFSFFYIVYSKIQL